MTVTNLCKTHPRHAFRVTDRRIVMERDHCGWRWWRLELVCDHCGYESATYYGEQPLKQPDKSKARQTVFNAYRRAKARQRTQEAG